MKKAKKSATKTISASKGERVVSNRKKTSKGTQSASRQRSGGNGPQQGSH